MNVWTKSLQVRKRLNMGQLVAKFKQWCEKLKAPEKFKNEELAKLDMGQDNVSTSESNGEAEITHEEEGADLEPITSDNEEQEEDYEIAKKLEDVETVIESQAKLLNDQTARIDSLEDSMEKVFQQVDQKDETLRTVAEALLVKAPEENTEEPVDRWQLLQEHARVLEQYKQKLESQASDIQNVREMLDDKQGEKHNKQNAKRRKYEQLEKEVKVQLEHQQRLLDNLFAGFIVAFIIVVVICMFPGAVFPGALIGDSSAGAPRSLMDTFWALMTGADQSPK